jgi:hypothetical protein
VGTCGPTRRARRRGSSWQRPRPRPSRLDRAAIRAGGEAGIEDWLATLPGAPSRYRLFPYISRYDLYFLALEADTLEIVDVHRPPSGYRFGQLPIRALTPPATAATDDSGAES